ncbi:dimethylaniline monooxygenase [Schizopora paradoxa]|uniref:Dimethylaniline monooxygenase n=1 Tax=Schizopora paradoxa TaxID=27342 RepID=A0A0H2S4I1_9AGAM|nr:dimethylaniline monooxygenase [Schizopora paradoxa]
MSGHSPRTLDSQEKCFKIANLWLQSLRVAFEKEDAALFSECFDSRGWFRDLMTFSWDFRSLQGHHDIKKYVVKSIGDVKISDLRLDESSEGCPHSGHLGQTSIVESALWFETPRARGRGYVLIIPPDGETKPRAFAMLLMINDWKGHEELGFQRGAFEAYWEDVQSQRRHEIETNPDVLIIGGGQTGLNIAARFRQMNIKAIVIEKNARIGDNWRHRYPSLKLHTPRKHHTLLYHPYPSNWPEFTSKEKLADWLEQYAHNQELVIWLDSTIESDPTYDSVVKKWTVVVNRNGDRLTMSPTHLVMAGGFFGDPNIPKFEGQEDFEGEILHSNTFPGGDVFEGKRVVVIGAANSATDICQDLASRGATSVTMVQRSSSGVVSSNFNAILFKEVYPEWRSLEYSDLAAFALPVKGLRELIEGMQPIAQEIDKDIYQGLAKGGFMVTQNPDGSAQMPMVYERNAGYYVDFGFWRLVSNGSVKVVHGNVAKLTATSVNFDDGSHVDADAIVLATGWLPIREKYREIFGSEVIDRTSELWGIDEGGEIRTGFKPSGQPGLWYALGGFEFSRFYSKQLALFIKAQELGYYPCPNWERPSQ